MSVELFPEMMTLAMFEVVAIAVLGLVVIRQLVVRCDHMLAISSHEVWMPLGMIHSRFAARKKRFNQRRKVETVRTQFE